MTIHPEHRLSALAPADVASRILVVRGHRVLLDDDLGRLYGVRTKAINQAVARNRDRFPVDFAFTLTRQEVAHLRSQTVTSSWGGRRWAVMAFTEQGVGMLASVLRSSRAAEVNVAILRAFVHLRKLLVDYAEISSRVDDLEQNLAAHDQSIAVVFEAIRQLLQPPSEEDKARIGFNRPE